MIDYAYTDILHHSQQDPKNRVSKPEIKVSTSRYSQETRFLTQVQDLSIAVCINIDTNGNWELGIEYCPLPIAHCPLPIAHCPLP